MTLSLAPVPTDVAAVLDTLQRDPGRPRVTWYGQDAERVELSGAVLVNWVTKTTNLLTEELDVAPGTRVLLDLPVHWRTLVWATATWRAGACVVTARPDGAAADGGSVDVVVSHRPVQHSGAAALVAVALPALARSWPGTLPAGALDAASSVMTYGDVLGWVPTADPHAPAVAGVRAPAHAGLVAAGCERAGSTFGARALLRVLPETDPGEVALTALGVWALDGSLVLVDRPELDPAGLGRVSASEHVTATIG